ncbi:MAG: hypothetical protein NTZ26_12625 [Candidatus Aminicenantes bacterium]|nr:hypothetical protein [Candidatus Aminicenantes bacterium]
MKKMLVALVLVSLMAGISIAGTKEFYKGSFTLTPVVGLNKYTIPFGLNAEYAFTNNIGFGGTAMVWLWSDEWIKQSIINLTAEALYHFTGIKASGLDVFAGMALGYSAYSYTLKMGDSFLGDSSGSGLDLGIVLGGRYFFSPKLAACLRLVSSFIGDWAGFGGQLGLTIRLK